MQKTILALSGLFLSSLAWAQEKSTDINVDINKDGGNSGVAGIPWLWIIGGLLLVILLVALTRGGGSRRTTTTTGDADRVTVTKTVERDTTTDL